MTAVMTDLWASVTAAANAVEGLAHVRQQAALAEPRREASTYNTGSIAEDEALLLLGLSESLRARVIIEVGTFIGMSTTALASTPYVDALYTCDASNDCLPSTDIIRTYPKQTSTKMLHDLVKRGVLADLCFFDGVLNDEDADLLAKVTKPDTVYAFHDYNYGPKIRTHRGVVSQEIVPRKGIGNVQLLQPRMPHHELIEPIPGTTVALLVPESRL